MQSTESSQQLSIGSLMRQNLSILPQGSSKGPTKKAYKYPYMDSEAINTTIQNAKKFAEAYNKAQDEKSSGIQKINRELRLALKSDPHTTEQKVLFQEYKQQEKISGLEPMAYNQKVLEFNRAHGTHYFMRTYKKLKSEIAVTFAHLVFFYAAQIRSNNARKLNAGVTTAGTLPRLLTNSENIKRYKVEGVPQCPFQNDAILNHVHNLVEAGILIKYKSHGRNMGFSVEFNPEILEVKDQNFTKLQNANSQLVVKFKTGKPTYSDCITRTGEDDNENKGDAVGNPQIRNVTQKSVTTSATGNNYRVTKSEENPEPKASAKPENLIKNSPEVEKKQEQVSPGRENLASDHLEAKIQDKWELCKELSLDMHVNHIPIDGKMLYNEARNGTMSQQTFRTLIFQEFMKYISRLKKGNQSAAGAFYRAFDELEDIKLKNYRGYYFTKETMLEQYEIWLKCVDYAEKNWGIKRNWRFLFINDYLDHNRRDGKEMGFWYVVEHLYQKHEKQKAKRKAITAKNKAKHDVRKKKIKLDRVQKYGYRSIKPGTNAKALSDYEKARKAVRKYLFAEDKSAAFTELHRYCRYNLNQTIVDGLQNLIESESANLRKYKA